MPISVPLTPTITQDGIALAASLSGTGISLPLTHIGFGTGAYSPTGAEHALHAEVQRVTIAGGGTTSANSVQVYAQTIANTGAPYWCSEIGFYSNATLVAVFSRTSSPILYISDQIVTAIVYALGLAALPPNTVTVTVDPSASAALAALGAHIADPNAHLQYVPRLNGIGVYDPLLTYGLSATVIGDDGKLYQSLQTNNEGNTPSTSATWWGPVQVDGIQAQDELNGVNNPNLLFNGSGEFGTNGWNLNSFAQYTDATGGAGSYFANGGALSGFTGSELGPQVPVGAAQQTAMSIDIANGATVGTVSATLAAYTSSGTLISIFASATIPRGTGLTRYTLSGITPANTAYVIPYVVNMAGVTAAVGAIYFRRVKVEVGGNPSLYSQEASIQGIQSLIASAISTASAGEIGKVSFFPSASAPTNYLKANGTAVSRTAYAALFAMIGTTFGAGDGSTTFNLPDMRGVFARGLDSGRGLDPSRVLGSYQADSYASHNHGINDSGHAHGINDSGHTHGVSDPGHGHGVSDGGHQHGVPYGPSPGTDTATIAGPGASLAGTLASNTATTGISINSSGSNISINGAGTGVSVAAATSGISTVASGSTETKPKNLSLLACIRFQ